MDSAEPLKKPSYRVLPDGYRSCSTRIYHPAAEIKWELIPFKFLSMGIEVYQESPNKRFSVNYRWIILLIQRLRTWLSK